VERPSPPDLLTLVGEAFSSCFPQGALRRLDALRAYEALATSGPEKPFCVASTAAAEVATHLASRGITQAFDVAPLTLRPRHRRIEGRSPAVMNAPPPQN
jgi:hypothetical protein